MKLRHCYAKVWWNYGDAWEVPLVKGSLGTLLHQESIKSKTLVYAII